MSVYRSDSGSNADLLEYSLISSLKERVGKQLNITLTDNRRTMISVRRERGFIEARVSRLFVLAGEEVLDGLTDFISGSSSGTPVSVRTFIDNPPVIEKPMRHLPKKLNKKGAHHNLGNLAKDLDKTYFNGQLKAQITWGRAPKPSVGRRRRRSIQYGSYDESMELIRIHPGLDADFVPTEFVELVIFHEMLHKSLGLGRGANGRRRLHTAEFRKQEKTYLHYKFAMDWERKNLHKLLLHVEALARKVI